MDYHVIADRDRNAARTILVRAEINPAGVESVRHEPPSGSELQLELESPRLQPWGGFTQHDEDSHGFCACGPRAEPVKGEDGSMHWVYVHHSLDGRELTEQVETE